MSEPRIYLSIEDGRGQLTIDGRLALLKVLLAALRPADTNRSQGKQCQEGTMGPNLDRGVPNGRK